MSGTAETGGARILLTRDWLLAALAVILAAAVCVSLGFWQYGRFEDKQARRDLIQTNQSAPPASLEEVLPTPDAVLDPGQQWRTVQLSGRYCTDPGCVLYVRNRPRSGQVGFWQLVPFRTEQGTLLVVRGWVPMQERLSAPQDPPPVPTGNRTITVQMRPAEPVLSGRTTPKGQVYTVTPDVIARSLPTADGLRLGAYGELVSESPSAPRPRALEAPDTSLGPHLSYAVQWWLFALFFPIAWISRARRAVQDARADDAAAGTQDPSPADPDGAAASRAAPPGAAPDTPSAPRPRAPARARSRTRDEEEEDAILDRRPH